MILNIFAVHDQAAAAYINPFFLPTQEMAVRSFAQCVNDPNHAFCLNSKDFQLFTLGVFDTNTGMITENANGLPLLICRANDLKKEPEKHTEIQDGIEFPPLKTVEEQSA